MLNLIISFKWFENIKFKDKICIYVTKYLLHLRNQNLKVFLGIRIIGGNLKSEFKKILPF